MSDPSLPAADRPPVPPAADADPAPPAADPDPAPSAADRLTYRLAVLAVAVMVALIAGFGLGRSTATGSAGAAPAASTAPAGVAATGAAGADHTHGPGDAPHSHDGPAAGATTSATAAAGADVGGLAVSSAGLTLVAERTTFRAGAAQPFRFRITGPDGQPVTSFGVLHQKSMHLVVVRRDLTGYQHLHPALAADGTWSIGLRLPAAGLWRAYADFVAAVDGQRIPATLGVDLTVAGDYTPVALTGPARSATVDGLTVSYEGVPTVGATQPLLFSVTRNGAPVAGLERYLGAYGHLVVLREGDLAYLHVHPEEQLVDGATKFWLSAPSPGRYRVFFDFQVAGTVRTAEFTLTV